MLPVATTAPDFNLYASPDQRITLSSLLGKKIILAFYPADWSPVCSDQISLLNATLHLFRSYNAELIGISVDSKWCHYAFSNSRKLHFPLLADFEPKGAIASAYKVYDHKYGECKRALYIIDEQGIIQWNYISPKGINPGVDGILNALDLLSIKKERIAL